MRVPKVDQFKDNQNYKVVHYQAPIQIPRFPVITNEKQREKCVKRIERKCRASMEYGDLIKFLKTNMNMDQCTFLPNVKGGKKRGVIEIHHAPFDLYTIVSVVLKKWEAQHDGVINENMVAKEVMQLHYQGLIGLIPLSVTVHELVHDGKLIVPLNCVFGRFVEFTNRYYEWIDDDLMAMLNDNIALTEKMTPNDMTILNTCYVYSDVDGVKLPEIVEGDIVEITQRDDSLDAAA